MSQRQAGGDGNWKLPIFRVTHCDLLGAFARPDVPTSDVFLRRDFTADVKTTPEEALCGGESWIIGAAGEAAALECKEMR